MQMAERLYMSGYISYPRTETTAYSCNFDFQAALQQLKGSPTFGEEVCFFSPACASLWAAAAPIKRLSNL